MNAPLLPAHGIAHPSTNLIRLVTWMQKTLMLSLDAAVREAALWELDKPREEWLFGYPAELALLAGQVRSAWKPYRDVGARGIRRGGRGSSRYWVDWDWQER